MQDVQIPWRIAGRNQIKKLRRVVDLPETLDSLYCHLKNFRGLLPMTFYWIHSATFCDLAGVPCFVVCNIFSGRKRPDQK